jgi:Recombination endonuclease VII
VKHCTKCGTPKPLDEFSNHRRYKDGKQLECKLCSADYRREYRRANPNYHRKEHDLKYKYKLDDTSFTAILTEQNNSCGICLCKFDGDTVPQVDHDHSCCPDERSCGKCIRGLLCQRCNVRLGRYNDDPIRFPEAADYLKAA